VSKKKAKGYRIKKNGAPAARLVLCSRLPTERSRCIACLASCARGSCSRHAAVTVKGIKIVNADTKNEALQRLKAEQALELMVE
jgi:hypothetical protein